MELQHAIEPHLLQGLDDLILVQTHRVSRKRRKAMRAAARSGAPVVNDEMRLATAISHLDCLLELKRVLAPDTEGE